MAAENALRKLEQTLTILDSLHCQSEQCVNIELEKEVLESCEKCYDGMNDDFNTAKLIASLFELSKKINRLAEIADELPLSANTLNTLKKTYNNFWRDVLGIKKENSTNHKFAQLVDILLEIRQNAKDEKNYTFSDFIREQLVNVGVKVQDSKDGKMSFVVHE